MHNLINTFKLFRYCELYWDKQTVPYISVTRKVLMQPASSLRKPPKISSNISCKLSPQESGDNMHELSKPTLKRQFYIKYQSLFSGKNKKNISNGACWNFYPACQSLKSTYWDTMKAVLLIDGYNWIVQFYVSVYRYSCIRILSILFIYMTASWQKQFELHVRKTHLCAQRGFRFAYALSWSNQNRRCAHFG